MFIALLFLPIMRWLNKKKVSKPISIFIVILIFIGALKIGGELVQLTSKEIPICRQCVFPKSGNQTRSLINRHGGLLGIPYSKEESIINNIIPKESMMKNFGTTLDFIGNTLTMILMTVFLCSAMAGRIH